MQERSAINVAHSLREEVEKKEAVRDVEDVKD
jgi:hypothetical protein